MAAISFDLDDTLYDNGPAIARAEQWMLDHLRSEYLATAMLDKPRWLALKRQLLLDHPTLSYDVSLTRQRGIREALVKGGVARLAGSRPGRCSPASRLSARR